MPSWAAFLVVFAASACTLILEVVAGRVLAPYLGVSLYTWTSIIGVILAGISMGNYVGGRVADRWPRRSTLGVLLAVSGILSLAVLPLIGLATSIDTRSLVGVTNPLGGELPAYVAAVLVARIVLITMIVFLPPAFVLGMVSPVVMKVRISDLERAGRLEHTGRMLGKLDAVSTLGGIVGTFATGFVLVQAFGTRTIVLGVGLVLIALGVLFGDLLKARRAAAPLAALFVLGVLLIPARQAFAYGCIPNQLTPECLGRAANDGVRQSMDSGCLHETAYFCIKVYDTVSTGDVLLRELVLDHLIHSHNSIADPSYLEYGYIKVYAEVADYLAKEVPNQALNILNVGGGGYTLPRHIEATYPNASQEIIEIDPGVTQVVYDKLGVDRNTTKIVTYNFDGRMMVNQLSVQKPKSYDLVIGDAFNDLSVPYHLTTKEFDEQIKGLLKDDGYYLTLVIDKLQGGKFITAYTKTVQQVWPYVYVLSDGTGWGSSTAATYVVAAGNTPLDFDRLKQARGFGNNGLRVTNAMPPDLMTDWLAKANPPVLTDDYAPVDNLLAPIFAERGF